jgi:hypothetical protein
VGDVSAKDNSQETIVNLAGMIAGSLMLPYLQIGVTAYCAFLILTVAHLYSNYIAVRNVVMNTLNAQRLTIIVNYYLTHKCVPTPEMVSQMESILTWDFMNSLSQRPLSENICEDEKLLKAEFRILIGTKRYAFEKFLRDLELCGWFVPITNKSL